MSIQNLSFTKDWTNAADFPTVENSETQVRQDLQLLHNEAKAKINEIIPVLNTLLETAEDVFIATYDVTPFADIAAAVAAGKIVLCVCNEPSFLRSNLLLYGCSYNGIWSGESEPVPTIRFVNVTQLPNSPDTSIYYEHIDVCEYEGATLYYLNSVQLAQKRMLNRTTVVDAPDTNYTTLMARGISLHATETTPSVNGAIAFQYG